MGFARGISKKVLRTNMTWPSVPEGEATAKLGLPCDTCIYTASLLDVCSHYTTVKYIKHSNLPNVSQTTGLFTDQDSLKPRDFLLFPSMCAGAQGGACLHFQCHVSYMQYWTLLTPSGSQDYSQVIRVNPRDSFLFTPACIGAREW